MAHHQQPHPAAVPGFRPGTPRCHSPCCAGRLLGLAEAFAPVEVCSTNPLLHLGSSFEGGPAREESIGDPVPANCIDWRRR